MPVEGGFVYHELPLMRLDALLAKARGEDEKFRLLRERYRARAVETELQGHIALARAMD
jgi:hypothetical protein